MTKKNRRESRQTQRLAPREATRPPAAERPPFTYNVDADGKVSLTLTGRLPAPSLAENSRWPWSKWQVGYTTKQLERDLLRVLQTISNLRFVTATVEAREAGKASRRVDLPKQQDAAEAAGHAQ